MQNSPRDACPSCSAPIVATNPTDFFSPYAWLLHSLYAATVDKIWIEPLDCFAGNALWLEDMARLTIRHSGFADLDIIVEKRVKGAVSMKGMYTGRNEWKQIAPSSQGER